MTLIKQGSKYGNSNKKKFKFCAWHFPYLDPKIVTFKDHKKYPCVHSLNIHSQDEVTLDSLG